VHRHRVADLAAGDEVAHLHQRREEQVVLEHAQRCPRRVARRKHALRTLEITREGLLHLDVVTGGEDLLDDLGMQRCRHQHVDDVRVDREQLVERRRRPRLGTPRTPAVEL
jgi:hypothetical protein